MFVRTLGWLAGSLDEGWMLRTYLDRKNKTVKPTSRLVMFFLAAILPSFAESAVVSLCKWKVQ